MQESNVRVLVVSPATYRAFSRFYPDHLPIERLLLEQHKHRYEMFCDFQGWRSHHIYRDDQNRVECDAYDRDNTIYSIAVDEGYNFLGSVRCYSTMLPYMLEEGDFDGTCHPGYTLPKSKDVFEGSRIISPNSALYRGHRPIREIRVANELLLSHMEIGRLMGVTDMIATMPPALREKVYERNMDWQTLQIGPPCEIRDEAGNVLDKGIATQNYLYPINAQAEMTIRAKTGIRRRVCDFGVPPEILPDLLAHMKEKAHKPHMHRFPHMLPSADGIGSQNANLSLPQCVPGI